MHIKDKINLDRDGLTEKGPITIVAFGDSVTHGALLDNYNYETVYWNRLRKKNTFRERLCPRKRHDARNCRYIREILARKELTHRCLRTTPTL